MRKLTLLQKELVPWIILCIVITAGTSIYLKTRPNEYPGIMRFHVIANSDSKEDQELKLKVRDKVVGTLEKEIADAAHSVGHEVTHEFTEDYINSNINRINKMARDTVKENGYEYKTTARLGVTYIPEKSYGDITFPSGNYEALNIVIGNGRGHNWFCVIYPPLCLINSEEPSRDIEVKSKVLELLYGNKKEND